MRGVGKRSWGGPGRGKGGKNTERGKEWKNRLGRGKGGKDRTFSKEELKENPLLFSNFWWITDILYINCPLWIINAHIYHSASLRLFLIWKIYCGSGNKFGLF